MFDWFKKKQQSRAHTIDLAALSDDQLAVLIKQTFETQNETFLAFLLVAYVNTSSLFSMFVAANKLDKGIWPETFEGMAGWCQSMLDGQSWEDSLEREVAQRRLSYFFLATLLKLLEQRARLADSDVLWGRVADIWVILLSGARALRHTLDSTKLWAANEESFFSLHEFANVIDEDSGENECIKYVMPQNIRYHPTIKRWQERNLSPEELAEIRKFEEVPFEDLFK
jgi:hypothetical protein